MLRSLQIFHLPTQMCCFLARDFRKTFAKDRGLSGFCHLRCGLGNGLRSGQRKVRGCRRPGRWDEAMLFPVGGQRGDI